MRANYSHVVYLPIEFPIVLDGLRPDDPQFQREIDRRIVSLLETHGVTYQTISGSVEERLKQIDRHLLARPLTPE